MAKRRKKAATSSAGPGRPPGVPGTTVTAVQLEALVNLFDLLREDECIEPRALRRWFLKVCGLPPTLNRYPATPKDEPEPAVVDSGAAAAEDAPETAQEPAGEPIATEAGAEPVPA